MFTDIVNQTSVQIKYNVCPSGKQYGSKAAAQETQWNIPSTGERQGNSSACPTCQA